MSEPEVALERYLQEKQRRGETNYAHILGRVPIEDLPVNHLHRWLVDWMNLQLTDIGVTSTGGIVLPPLHFDLVRVRDNERVAHAFETDCETEVFGFIVVSQPMVDEMMTLSTDLVYQNRFFMRERIAPLGALDDIVHLFVFLQFCIVTSHEYSHLVRRHLEDHQPHAAVVGEALPQIQEVDADGYGIYHDLTYLFRGPGKQLASQWLRISKPEALEKSILDCFLLAVMTQFCARWAGKIHVDSDLSAEHPPQPVRIEYALLFIEMWCREVGRISTAWTTDGTMQSYFAAASRLFPADLRTSWNQLIAWLKGQESEDYRARIRAYLNRVRTGQG